MGSKVPWAGPWVRVGPRVGSGGSQAGYQGVPGHHEGAEEATEGHHEGAEEATEGSWGSKLRSPQGEGSIGP